MAPPPRIHNHRQHDRPAYPSLRRHCRVRHRFRQHGPLLHLALGQGQWPRSLTGLERWSIELREEAAG